MRPSFISRFLLTTVLITLIALTGCDKKMVTVNGKVIPPTEVKLLDTDSIEVRFLPESGKDSAAANSSGKETAFSVKTVVPGSYKIVVAIVPYAGMKGADKRKRFISEVVNKKYNEQNSKLKVEIGSEAQQSITIDLKNHTVTK